MSEYLSVIRRPIDSGWQVAQRHAGPIDLISLSTGESEWYAANVPGYVHGALVSAGVIQDPNYRLGEQGCAWVDEADWSKAAAVRPREAWWECSDSCSR